MKRYSINKEINIKRVELELYIYKSWIRTFWTKCVTASNGKRMSGSPAAWPKHGGDETEPVEETEEV